MSNLIGLHFGDATVRETVRLEPNAILLRGSDSFQDIKAAGSPCTGPIRPGRQRKKQARTPSPRNRFASTGATPARKVSIRIIEREHDKPSSRRLATEVEQLKCLINRYASKSLSAQIRELALELSAHNPVRRQLSWSSICDPIVHEYIDLW